ncbi:MAG: NUDIX hydrolase [Candidatus Woesearchaeota archaeon]
MVMRTEDGKIVLSGVCIVNKDDEVLLLRRTDHGHLETPGGKLEESDCDEFGRNGFTDGDLQRCAVREMFEELGQGFIVEEFESLGSHSFTLPDGKPALAYKYRTRLLFGTPDIRETDKFSGYEWVPVVSLRDRDDLSPDFGGFIQPLQEQVQKEKSSS